jgi:signal transduction histidine kinase
MYLWSFWLPLFITIFFLSFYFLYSLVKGKDLSFIPKISSLSVIALVFYFSQTTANLKAFDVYNCNAVEGGVMINTVFLLSFVIFLVTLIFGVKEIKKIGKTNFVERKKAIFATIGVLCFLFMFSAATYYASIANMFGSEPEIFNFEQYGYFGMTIFIAFLTYIIVQYKAFNIKLVAAQALVASLIILIGSQFFFIKSAINQILNGITLALSLGFGYLLVKSVKREIQAKEQVEKLANDLDKKNVRLQELDKQKSEFVSFATHQLRSPLTSMKGYASLMLEGEMGPVPEMVKGGIQTILTSTKTLINLVEDYLNISRMELGTMKYSLTEIDFKSLLEEVVREQKTNIEAKGLTFNVDFDANQTYKVKADLDKFKQVLMNTIDNSVKYTPTGSLSISLFKKDGKVIFKVSDTGVGINPAVMVKLFKKFSRAENAHEVNIHGTGLGLFIAREIMNAHKGRIWAESAGEGKGSQFYVELPEVK